MKIEQTVYTCNQCGKEEIFIKGSFGGSTPFNIEVKFPTNDVGFGSNVTNLDFCCFNCLKVFVDKQMKKEN